MFHPAPILGEPPVTPPRPLPWYRYRSPVMVSPRRSALPSPVKSPGENTLSKTFHPEPILVEPPVNPPSPLPWYRYRSPVLVSARMSALPSPVKSPGENTLAKTFHPEQILVPPPVNPPTLLSCYRYSSPVLVSARMSALPSPVKSPGENTLAKTFHPEPILVPPPVNPASPLPRQRYRSPFLVTARMAALPSPVKSPGVNAPNNPVAAGGTDTGGTLVGTNHSDRSPNAERIVAPLTVTEPLEPSIAAVRTRPPHWP